MVSLLSPQESHLCKGNGGKSSHLCKGNGEFDGQKPKIQLMAPSSALLAPCRLALLRGLVEDDDEVAPVVTCRSRPAPIRWFFPHVKSCACCTEWFPIQHFCMKDLSLDSGGCLSQGQVGGVWGVAPRVSPTIMFAKHRFRRHARRAAARGSFRRTCRVPKPLCPRPAYPNWSPWPNAKVESSPFPFKPPARLPRNTRPPPWHRPTSSTRLRLGAGSGRLA